MYPAEVVGHVLLLDGRNVGHGRRRKVVQQSSLREKAREREREQTVSSGFDLGSVVVKRGEEKKTEDEEGEV